MFVINSHFFFFQFCLRETKKDQVVFSWVRVCWPSRFNIWLLSFMALQPLLWCSIALFLSHFLISPAQAAQNLLRSAKPTLSQESGIPVFMLSLPVGPWGSHITLLMMLPERDGGCGCPSGREIHGNRKFKPGGKSKEMLPSIQCGKTFVWGPRDSPERIEGFCSIWCLHKGWQVLWETNWEVVGLKRKPCVRSPGFCTQLCPRVALWP